MKLHLPLSLYRSLMVNIKGCSYTLLALGTLLTLTASNPAIFGFNEERPGIVRPELTTLQNITLHSDWGSIEYASDSWLLAPQDAEQQNLDFSTSRTLANLAAANVRGFYFNGSGGMLVPETEKPAPGVKPRPVRRSLLITAGIAPLENYVAGGGPAPSSSSSSSSASSGSSAPAAAAATPSTAALDASVAAAASANSTPAPALGRRSMLRSVSLMSAPLLTGTSSTPSTTDTDGSGSGVTIPTLDPGLTWTGSDSGVWDNSSENWQTAEGTATTFTPTESATFDATSAVTDINVTTAQTLTDMTVTGPGYHFSGGGNITVSNQLYIAASGDTSFGSANNVSVGTTLTLQSEADTTTTFGATVTAGALTINNCAHHGEVAGKYVFENDLTISGAANITLGGALGGTDKLTLLEVRGDFSADSLMLDGSAQKSFSGTVSVTNDITVSGISGTSLDGTTSFTEAVTLGGALTVDHNSQASFHNELSKADGSRLDIRLNDGVVLFDMLTTLPGDGLYDLGVVTLSGQGGLSLGARTSAKVDVVGNGNAFSIGGAKRADVSLTGSNVSDFHVNSGTANLTGDNGQITGELLVKGSALLTLKSDNIFASGNADSTLRQDISVDGATLHLGSTQQAMAGNITLHNGTIDGNEGSSLSSTADSSLSYSGAGNTIKTDLELGSHDFTVTGTAEGSQLLLQNDISGSGTLTFTGEGLVSIKNDLSYSGMVEVGSGTKLDLGSNNALSEVQKLTVNSGATLSVIHGGSSTVLSGAGQLVQGSGVDMNVGLEFADGASLTFTNLSGHGSTPAITLTGGLLFNGFINFNFLETSGEKLENLHTYELITSETGINHSVTSGGGVRVFVNGKENELDASQYAFGYYVDDNNLRHFTFTMLVGKSWNSGDGDWHQQSTSGVYDNWTEGEVGLYALFRKRDGEDQDIRISLGAATSDQGFYMDGSTNYTIAATSDMTGKQAFAAESAASFTKKGSGSMTLENITATLGTVEIDEGVFSLSGGSTLTATDSITIADLVYAVPESGGVASKDDSATLRIEHGSVLSQGAASLTAYSAGVAAELHGVRVSGLASTGSTSGSNSTSATISAYHSGLSDSDSATSTHSISNATLSGFIVEGVTFTGEGFMQSVTVNDGVTIDSGASYTLGADMAILSTITNKGTVKVTSDSLIGVGRQGNAVVSADGFSTTYTPFINEGSGATVEGWSSLEAKNFRIRGTNLNLINGVTVDTSVNGQLTVGSANNAFKFIRWDSELHKNSWDTPTVGLYYNTSDDYFTLVSEKNTTYSYDQRVVGGSANTHVVNIGEDAGANWAYITGAQLPTSEQNRADLWIYDEGSNYQAYFAGSQGYTQYYYGDTHLHVAGALDNAQLVVGASYGSEQHGDSYLTIEAGNYTNAQIVSGSMYATHQGNSNLHLSGGKYGTVYAGTVENYTNGSTYTLIDGTAQVGTLFGGDYSPYLTYSKLTGDVTIDLKGGTLSSVISAGGVGNTSRVQGNVTVNLYAGDNGKMLTSFTQNALLQGGAASNIADSNGAAEMAAYANGTSTLAFMNAGSYELWDVEIARFDTFTLAEGATVYLRADRFNVTNSLTISGRGIVEVGDAPDATQKGINAQQHSVTLTNGAHLNIRTSFYHEATSNSRSSITVENGSTLDITGYPNAEDGKDAVFNIDLTMAGDGAEGLGALYKGAEGSSAATTSMQACSELTLTDHASVGVGAGADISMIGRSTDNTKLDLYTATIAEHGLRGIVFTKQGDGSFGMYQTQVYSGTINVVGGTLNTAHGTNAHATDVVLHKGTLLQLSANADGYIDYQNGTYDENARNTLTIETLSGEGAVELNTNGRIIIEMDGGMSGTVASDFADSFNNPAEGQLFYNDKGYEYAHYSGTITDNASTGSGQIVKTGSGTQYFEGSESSYKGGTLVQNGVLYLTGTSSAKEGFTSGKSEVDKGVVGTGALMWGIEAGMRWNGKENVLVINQGEVYLGNGVRIFNNGTVSEYKHTDGAVYTPDIIIGVETGVRASDNAVEYYEATYSGVLSGDTRLVKVGKGTLGLDQQTDISKGIHIEEGTLDLFGWADADKGSITQLAGSTLMFSYDGSYAGGADLPSTISAAIVASGTGDTRWATDKVDTTTGLTRTGNRTAAIISDIGVAKNLTLEGNISAGTADGNLLHSGEGTLTLSGNNSYTGGTVITRGTVIAANATETAGSDEALNTALGATAEGAALELATAATLRFAEAEAITTNTATLAAKADAAGNTGNDIRGVVYIGTENANTAKLVMEGDGYHASRTELGVNDVLVFSGTDASNWDGELNEGEGAGILAGAAGSTLVVTDGKTAYGDATRTQIYFQVTDTAGSAIDETAPLNDDGIAAQSDEEGFNGDLIVEGDLALLHIQGGAINGGNYEVSGMGARLDAKRSQITVNSGKHISLTSLGDEHADANSTATFAAYRVELEEGALLSVASDKTTYMYSAKELVESTSLPLSAALAPYGYNADERTYHQDYVNEAQHYNWHYDNRIALNIQTAGTLETVGGLTMVGGSIYETNGSNTGLGGTKLTLNLTSGGKIILAGAATSADGQTSITISDYLQNLADATDSETTRQWVLFTGVSEFEVLDNANQTLIAGYNLESDAYDGRGNHIYVAHANDVFTAQESDITIPDNVLLVYDAGAEVVYLDRIPNVFPEPMENIPEPATTTLGLLGLAALAARRRRKG